MRITTPLNRRLRDTINVAIAQVTNANNAVQDFRKRLEADYEFPVIFGRLKSSSAAGGTVRSYWDQLTDVRCHTIDLVPGESWAWPHKAAHELMHICLECEAEAAGRRMTGGLSQPAQTRLLSLCDPSKKDDAQILQKISSYAHNVPVDLVVESRLQRELPAIAAAQFVTQHLFDSENRSQLPVLQSWDVSPNLRQTMEALVAVRSLFLDTYFPSPPQRCFDQFQDTATGNLAAQLFDEFKSRFDRGLQPGEHYELMDRFAEIIGLPGLHTWTPKTRFQLEAERESYFKSIAAPTAIEQIMDL
jgi:hypothetical protein